MEVLPYDPIAELARQGQFARETAAAEEASGELGRDDFLRLLLAKLENQDPMQPSQDEEFVAQLATFSSLEQLIDVNKNLGALAQGQAELANSQALDLIGKSALVRAGDSLRLEGGRADELVYVLPTSATRAELQLVDENGVTVRTVTLDPSETGRSTFVWDGLDDDGEALPDGDYRMRLIAGDAEGRPLPAELYQSLYIDAVNFLNGGLSLVSGDRSIPFHEILEFRASR